MAQARTIARGDDEASSDPNKAPKTIERVLDEYRDDLVARGASIYNATTPRFHLTPLLLKKEVNVVTSDELKLAQLAAEERPDAGKRQPYPQLAARRARTGRATPLAYLEGRPGSASQRDAGAEADLSRRHDPRIGRGSLQTRPEAWPIFRRARRNRHPSGAGCTAARRRLDRGQ